ncbi:haloacid dehalogenase [Exiguobacterium sp. KRL4]|uniref:HAD family hydrolase n=1 Tax=Exiguobacterium sp. KRL4 TaxID=1914536 RepID=UPI0008F90AD4|nr:HAD hydrolase-like protein [Exiguobacterium sp. KRL4]OIN68386.1 haloacid dehalogenase [Exiguobacterium sp. KRL4]
MAVILFDIDGTLIDSTTQMTEAIHLAMDDMPHLVKPSQESVQSSYGLAGSAFWRQAIPDASEEDIRSIRKKRHHHLEQTIAGQEILFDGIRDLLEELTKRGHIVSTASNCGVHYLNLVLDSQSIRSYFTSPKCLESVNGKQKADILAAQREEFGDVAYVMVGDRSSDVEAARIENMPVAICRFGFGTEEEWKTADYQLDTPADLLKYV